MKKISVIVPIYNEGSEFRAFLDDLLHELKASKHPFEIIVLDSKSSNNSTVVVKDFAKKHPEVKGYILRHPGVAVTDKTNKYMLGFAEATGEYIVTMDGDGQDRPNEIMKFIQQLDEGSDFVIGYKQKRKDGFIYMLTSKIANRLIRTITGVKVHDMNNGYKAFKAELAKSLRLRSGHFRFLPVIASANRWKTTEVLVVHRQREFGSGKFSFVSRLQGGLFDMLAVFIIYKMGDTPIYTLGWLSAFWGVVGLLGLITSLFFDNLLLGISSIMGLFFALNLYILGVAIEYMRGQSDIKDYSGFVVEKIGK
ncbi:glycosyltransferase [Candidatus Dojkabacteria bacterium]|nr:glycosyltransferase [Candidatus Dojkabacteria bacterium]